MLQKLKTHGLRKQNIYLIASLGYSYIFDNNVNFKHQLINIKQRIKDQNLQNQNSNICQSSKLNFFRTFYNMGQRPSYVDSLVNISERAAIPKIRTSAHLLMLERGSGSCIKIFLHQEDFVQFVNLEKLKMKNISLYIVHDMINCKDNYL
jgi:hypothetical protein